MAVSPKAPPQKKAVALFYDGKQAPELTAVGENVLAERIIALAKQYQIPIYENPQLVEMLAQQQWGDRIPPELYRIIAEIIAFVYLLQGRRPHQTPDEHRTEGAASHDKLLPLSTTTQDATR